MRRHSPEFSAQSGTALALSLVIVIVVAALSVGFVRIAADTARVQSVSADQLRAFYLAEAGLAEAFLSVRMGRNGNIGTEDIPASFGDGLVWVESSRTSDSRVWLRSHATVGSGRACLGLIIDPENAPLGFFGSEQLVIDSSILVDGFDSGERSYEEEVMAIRGPDPPPPGAGSHFVLDPASEHHAAQLDAERFAGLLGPNVLLDVLLDQFEYMADPSSELDEPPLVWELANAPVDVAQLLTPSEYADFLAAALPMRLAADAGALVPATGPPAGGAGGGSAGGSSPDGAAPPTVDVAVADGMHTDRGGMLGSNGDVTFTNPPAGGVAVFGSVAPGVNGEVVGVETSAIWGSVEPRALVAELNPVVIPSVPAGPDLVHTGPIPHVLAPGSVSMETLSVGDGSEVIIRGPATLVVDDLLLEGGSTLTLDPRDGDIELFVTDSLAMDPAAFIETLSVDSDEISISAARESVMDEHPDLSFDGASMFLGTVYAPESDVRIGADFEVFGSVVAGRLRIADGARLHFDHESYSGELAVPKLESWQILELPDVDPEATIPSTAAPRDHPRLADAHDLARVDLSIRYADSNHASRAYVGPESDFDWSVVASVDATERSARFDAPVGDRGWELGNDGRWSWMDFLAAMFNAWRLTQ